MVCVHLIASVNIVVCCCFMLLSCVRLWFPMDCSPPGSSVHELFPGKNYGVGCHFLLQGIFLIQGSDLCLLHWQADSLPVSHLRIQSTYLFIWLGQVLAVTCGTLSCSMWNLVLWPEIEHGFPASGAWSLSHWTIREVPIIVWVHHILAVHFQWQSSRLTFYFVIVTAIVNIQIWILLHAFLRISLEYRTRSRTAGL